MSVDATTPWLPEGEHAGEHADGQQETSNVLPPELQGHMNDFHAREIAAARTL